MNTNWTLLFAIGFAGCNQNKFVVPVASGDCQQACSVLRRLECPEGRGNCEQVCEANRDMLSVSCVALAAAEEDLPACHVGCKK